MSTTTTTTENGSASTELAQVPHGLARLQRHPVIDTIDEKTLALIASQIAPGCNRGEIGHFLELCAHYDLDPFAKEAWCAKGKGDNARLLIMVGRDGLRKIAKRQGLEINGDVVRAEDAYEVEFVEHEEDAKRGEWEANGCAPFHRVTHKHKGIGDSRGAIAGAWCRVKDHARREVGWFEAPLAEYKPTSPSKLQYSPWGSQESVMILAAAERQALRQATPLGGLLAEGEDARVVDATVVQEPASVQELSDDEIDRLVALVTAGPWSESETQMQLVAAGASDVSDVRSAIGTLTRDQAVVLVAAVAADSEPVNAEPADEPDAEPITEPITDTEDAS